MASYDELIKSTLDKINGYGDYKSQYADQLNNSLNTITNWNYDPQNDAAYKAAEKMYTQRGQQAMKDTLGQVSARTGGLASSYAGSAAQQSYNGYMEQLASLVPQYEQRAYNMATSQYDALRGADADQYSRWNDALGELYNRLSMYNNQNAIENPTYSGGGGGGRYYGGGSGSTTTATTSLPTPEYPKSSGIYSKNNSNYQNIYNAVSNLISNGSASSATNYLNGRVKNGVITQQEASKIYNALLADRLIQER